MTMLKTYTYIEIAGYEMCDEYMKYIAIVAVYRTWNKSREVGN